MLPALESPGLRSATAFAIDVGAPRKLSYELRRKAHKPVGPRPGVDVVGLEARPMSPDTKLSMDQAE